VRKPSIIANEQRWWAGLRQNRTTFAGQDRLQKSGPRSTRALQPFLRDLIRPAAELSEADVCLPFGFITVFEGNRAGAVHAPGAIRRKLRGYHKTSNSD